MKLYSFSKGLKRARKAAVFTQESFAKEFNVSLKTIQNWEQNACTPNSKDLIALCKFFNCDMDYLFHNIDCKTHDLQYICDMTGLSENNVKKNVRYKSSPPVFGKFTNALNLILQDKQFESILCSLQNYIDAATTEEKLYSDILNRYREVEVNNPHPDEACNWPYNDDLEQEHQNASMQANSSEYCLDTYFRQLLSNIKENAIKEMH